MGPQSHPHGKGRRRGKGEELSWSTLGRYAEMAKPRKLVLLIIAGANGNARQSILHSRSVAGEERCRTLSRVMANEYLEEQFGWDEVLQPAEIIATA